MSRRGFFAEMQHAYARSVREQKQQQAAAVREQVRLERAVEKAQRAEDQARARVDKSDRAAMKAAEQEFARLRLEARQAEVEALTSQLDNRLAAIDGILKATLAVDDYVDLAALRRIVEHPPFSSPNHAPIPLPSPIQPPPEPVFVAPPEPKGIGALLGGRRKYEAALAAARSAFAALHHAWQVEASQVPMRQFAQLEAHRQAEAQRQQRLEADWATHQEGVAQREAKVEGENQQLDALIRDLAAGRPEAVEEYLGIVLGNSVYPDDLVSVGDFAYDGPTRELRIDLQLPRPDALPTDRSYKYVRTKDEIALTAQTVKEQRERYAALVANTTLRTLHEVWESDRHENVATISMTGYVEHVDRATGRETRTPLIAVAAARETFVGIDLSRVDPSETLRHLNAVVSKDPHGLVAIDLGRGVRGH